MGSACYLGDWLRRGVVGAAAGCFLAIAGVSVAGAARASQDGDCVAVYVHSRTAVNGAVLMLAQEQTKTMFHKIGVSLRWRSGTPQETKKTGDVACGEPVAVDLEDVGHAPVSADALGYATPFATGSTIHVFVDRIRWSAGEEMQGTVLAHVLTHELTHVLTASREHSATGVMKAHWDRWDFRLMELQPLAFTAEDIAMIHSGVAARAGIAAQTWRTASMGSAERPGRAEMQAVNRDNASIAAPAGMRTAHSTAPTR
jgi:hypothetical protein